VRARERRNASVETRELKRLKSVLTSIFRLWYYGIYLGKSGTITMPRNNHYNTIEVSRSDNYIRTTQKLDNSRRYVTQISQNAIASDLVAATPQSSVSTPTIVSQMEMTSDLNIFETIDITTKETEAK
jgi:hypothetical protein